MAPIRKAKGYVTYLVALLITGLFGLFHKAPPAWAEEVKTERNATVFSEVTLVAEANTARPGLERGWAYKENARSSVERSWESPMRPGGERGFINIPNPAEEGLGSTLLSDPSVIALGNQQVRALLDKISVKLKNNDALSAEELVVAVGVQNGNVLQDLHNRLNALILMVNELKDKAH